MNVAEERSRSCWMDQLPSVTAPPLAHDARCDVAIVGSGIAGVSLAYELARSGRSVIVIDRGQIGSGMTARTTAHLSSALDDYYHKLIPIRGADEARLYHDSQKAAINRIEAICREEAITADYARVDGYLFAAEEKHRDQLDAEYEACRSIEVEVEWADRAPLSGRHSGQALRFGNQARIHPTRYLSGLADACEYLGVGFYADTAYVGHEENGEVAIKTERGPVIRASAAVFATNSPVNDKLAIHSKQQPARTYVIAGPVTKNSVADALFWDTEDPYHYARLQPLDNAEDLLIVGGEDHQTGEAGDMSAHFAALERWARAHYPSLGEIRHRWSGQVLEPIDFMPFSGRNPGNRNIYVHSGDSGQGITNGVAGSLTLLPLIIGENSRYAGLFEPSRKSLTAPAALGTFIRGQAGVARNLATYATPGDIASPEDLDPGDGAIMRDGVNKLAVYKDAAGTIHRRSASCTHLGCIVQWNSLEKCWECPCHGSHFAPTGEVLNGPAVAALAAHES